MLFHKTNLRVGDHDLLKNLKPLPTASYDPARGCMDGTRVNVLARVESWAKSLTLQKIYWMYGLTGTGKSSIASSVAKKLATVNSLGGSFFCNRDNVNARDPKLILTTLSYQLSLIFPPYRSEITAILRMDHILAESPPLLLFDELFAKPIGKLVHYELPRPYVIVVDALDECDLADCKSILHLLRRLSGLVPWLKVFITTRPNADFFDRAAGNIVCHDLGQEDAFDDILFSFGGVILGCLVDLVFQLFGAQ